MRSHSVDRSAIPALLQETRGYLEEGEASMNAVIAILDARSNADRLMRESTKNAAIRHLREGRRHLRNLGVLLCGDVDDAQSMDLGLGRFSHGCVVARYFRNRMAKAKALVVSPRYFVS